MRRNDSIRQLIFLIIAFAAVAIVVATLSCKQKGEVRCVRVIDGDTIVIENDERVRYIGIDTPERASGGKVGEYLAEEATAFNRNLVEGRTVVLEFDRQQRDRYGRLLAYVYIGQTMVNEELLRNGFARARAYPPNVRYREKLESLEEEARDRGLGIWSRDRERP